MFGNQYHDGHRHRFADLGDDMNTTRNDPRTEAQVLTDEFTRILGRVQAELSSAIDIIDREVGESEKRLQNYYKTFTKET